MRKGWEIKKLGEVCKLTNGYAFKSKEYTDDGYFVIRIGNVQDGYIELNNPRYIELSEEKQKKFILSEGDILVSLTGNVGRVGEIKEEHLPAVLNQRVAKISLNGKTLQKTYLFYFLTSEYFTTELIKAGRGAAQQNISTTDIENLIIPLPPLPEQQKIVALLDKCFQSIDRAKTIAEKNLQNAKELFESYLNGVFEKGGEGWVNGTIGQTCNLNTGGTPSTSKKEYYEGGTIKWLVSGDVNQKLIYDCGGRITELGMNNSNAKFLPQNSVLIALNGQGKTRGTVAMLKTIATCNQSLVSIFPKDEKSLLPELVFSNLEGRYNEIRKMTGDSGNERRGLNMPLIRGIRFSYPKKISEQKLIITRLDDLRFETKKIETIYQRKLIDLEELKKSILQKAFRGDLNTENINV